MGVIREWLRSLSRLLHFESESVQASRRNDLLGLPPLAVLTSLTALGLAINHSGWPVVLPRTDPTCPEGRSKAFFSLSIALVVFAWALRGSYRLLVRPKNEGLVESARCKKAAYAGLCKVRGAIDSTIRPSSGTR